MLNMAFALNSININDGTSFQNILDFVYPVGSVFLSTDESVAPAALFGGTWEIMPNKFMVFAKTAANDFNGNWAVLKQGGNSTHNHFWSIGYRSYYAAMAEMTDRTDGVSESLLMWPRGIHPDATDCGIDIYAKRSSGTTTANLQNSIQNSIDTRGFPVTDIQLVGRTSYQNTKDQSQNQACYPPYIAVLGWKRVS